MKLTERELKILQLKQRGLSDYRIARKIRTDPPNVTRSRKNAHKKILEAAESLEWATRTGLEIPLTNRTDSSYSYFL